MTLRENRGSSMLGMATRSMPASCLARSVSAMTRTYAWHRGPTRAAGNSQAVNLVTALAGCMSGAADASAGRENARGAAAARPPSVGPDLEHFHAGRG